MEISELKNKLEVLSNQVGQIQGQYSLMKKEYENDLNNLKQLEYNEIIYKKAVELLSVVQKISRDRIKEKFEGLVNHAIHAICGSEYNFNLEFGKRGNLQELDFNIQSPECKEAHELIEGESGGLIDIVALALRIVLLEINQPKNQGFIVLDESLKGLSRNFLPNANQFLHEISHKLNRQIIFISHSDELIENSENTIEIK